MPYKAIPGASSDIIKIEKSLTCNEQRSSVQQNVQQNVLTGNRMVLDALDFTLNQQQDETVISAM